MDSYDDAIQRLRLITSEAGWFVYCIEEEEWHLYNDEDELLFATKTVEELADSLEPAPNDYNTALQGKERTEPYKAPIIPTPIKVDPVVYRTYEDKQKDRTVNQERNTDE